MPAEGYETHGGRTLDAEFYPVIFEAESGNIEAAILQRTERFFARVKQTIGINDLAQEAAEWPENIDIVPLGNPGEKPMRMIHELWYYDVQAVAAVVQDFREDGSIAVAFSRHSLDNKDMHDVYRELARADSLIAQDSF